MKELILVRNSCSLQSEKFDTLFYIGTYTTHGSKGIYGIRCDLRTRKYEEPKLLAEIVSPSYLAVNHAGTVLYAASEPWDGTNGAVAAYRIDPQTGSLHKINEVSAPSLGLCHITTDGHDRLLFAVSYNDATVQAYMLDKDGAIGNITCMHRHSGSSVNLKRQEKAHAHSVTLTPDQQFLCVCDLGIDKLVVYDIDYETGRLEPLKEKTIDLPAGCGPRHMVFHPSGKFAYIVAELTSQVIALSYDKAEGFNILQVIDALDDKNKPSIAAAIRVSRGGDYLYTSNRGEDSISVFLIDQGTGLLSRLRNVTSAGGNPRDFNIDKTGSCLICANQDTDNLLVYTIDRDGIPVPGWEIKGISMPVCIAEL